MGTMIIWEFFLWHSTRLHHYRKTDLCRVPKVGHSLPSVNRRTLSKEQTLGKELFAECQTLGKVNTLGKNAFAECLALGKE